MKFRNGVCRKTLASAFLVLSGLFWNNVMFAHADLPPLKSVTELRLPAYLGQWYEIASFPQSFQKGCTATTAEYRLQMGAREIQVLNSCRLGSPNGKLKVAKGKAIIPNEAQPGQLKVTFFWPFYGDYWVIELGEIEDGQYTYSVVGHPDRDYLWILSRTSTLNEEVFQGILDRLQRDHFYDLSRLQRTIVAP